MSRAKRRPKMGGDHRSKSSSPWVIALVTLVAGLGITILMLPPGAFRSSSPGVNPSDPPVELAPNPALVEKNPSSKSTNSLAHPISQNSEAINETEPTDIEKAAYYQNYGSALLEKGLVKEALEQYRMAVKFSPDDEDAHFDLAIALARNGDSEAAKKEYEEALRLYPDYAEAHCNLGNLLLNERRFDEAIAHFKSALQVTPDEASYHNNLGKALARQAKLDEAIPEFREALKLKPDYAEARHNLGQAFVLQKKFTEAANEFNEALKVQPGFEPARKALEKLPQSHQ